MSVVAVTGPPQVSRLAAGNGTAQRHGSRTLPVYGLCVHTTGSGPARRARTTGRSAINEAIAIYTNGPEGPHYVIGYEGDIHAICDEAHVAWHAGWLGQGRARWRTWPAPAWWSSIWSRFNARNPADLLPPSANDPNQVYIGVELVGNENAGGFTGAQYDALARLIVDVFNRQRIPLVQPPNPRLLGHEDLEPISRSNRDGGWDPGAHKRAAGVLMVDAMGARPGARRSSVRASDLDPDFDLAVDRVGAVGDVHVGGRRGRGGCGVRRRSARLQPPDGHHLQRAPPRTRWPSDRRRRDGARAGVALDPRQRRLHRPAHGLGGLRAFGSARPRPPRAAGRHSSSCSTARAGISRSTSSSAGSRSSRTAGSTSSRASTSAASSRSIRTSRRTPVRRSTTGGSPPTRTIRCAPGSNLCGITPISRGGASRGSRTGPSSSGVS